MSASLDSERAWNFRILDKRLVTVKTKAVPVGKIAVLDVLTNIMFTVHVLDEVKIENLAANEKYLFTLKVYTTKDASDVKEDFISFFEALDIDQSMEDFIRAYWAYPAKIRFELVEVEEA